MLCQKKNEKKKSIPPVKTAGTKKKIKKKTVQSRQPVTVGHVSAIRSVPPFETAGMEKKTKRKKPKMKVGHFEKKISKGVRLEIFFANRVRKKIHECILQHISMCGNELAIFMSVK